MVREPAREAMKITMTAVADQKSETFGLLPSITPVSLLPSCIT